MSNTTDSIHVSDNGQRPVESRLNADWSAVETAIRIAQKCLDNEISESSDGFNAGYIRALIELQQGEFDKEGCGDE